MSDVTQIEPNGTERHKPRTMNDLPIVTLKLIERHFGLSALMLLSLRISAFEDGRTFHG
jgi:hypothetical protein